MRKETIYLLIVFLVGIIGGGIFFINGKSFLSSKKEERQKDIINCLAANNVRLYVSSDCEFCQKQKEIFGDDFKRVKSFNCGKNGQWSDICIKERINSVPTWTFPASAESTKMNLTPCIDCQRKSDRLQCEDLCYNKSENGKWIKVSGFLDLNKLDEMFECSHK